MEKSNKPEDATKIFGRVNESKIKGKKAALDKIPIINKCENGEFFPFSPLDETFFVFSAIGQL